MAPLQRASTNLSACSGAAGRGASNKRPNVAAGNPHGRDEEGSRKRLLGPQAQTPNSEHPSDHLPLSLPFSLHPGWSFLL